MNYLTSDLWGSGELGRVKPPERVLSPGRLAAPESHLWGLARVGDLSVSPPVAGAGPRRPRVQVPNVLGRGDVCQTAATGLG